MDPHEQPASVQRDAAQRALQAARMGVWDWDLASGRLAWDLRVAELFGLEPDEFDGRFDSFLSRVHEDDHAIVATAIQDSLRRGGPYAAEFRVVRPDGSTAWIQGRGETLLGEQGSPVRMLGIAFDTTVLHDARDHVVRSLEHISDGLVLLDRDWRVLYMNERAAELVHRPRDEIVGCNLWEEFPEAVDTEFYRRYHEAVRTQERSVFEAYYGPLDGWYEVRLFPSPDGLTVYAQNVDDRRRAEAERLTLLQRLQASQRAQAFLLRVSAVLAGAADFNTTLERLAEAALPALGDLCVIDILAEDGELQRMTARHLDPGQQPLVDELKDAYPPDRSSPHPAAVVVSTGRTEWSDTMHDEWIRSRCRDDRHFALVKKLDFTSYITVPLRSEEHMLGTMTFVTTGRARRFGEEDVALAESLAEQVSELVARARRFDEEHRLAHTLQANLLPANLPAAVEELDVAVKYEASTSGAQVGGDWYDVLRLPDGRVLLAVGDVAGHDLTAAAAMGQVRSATRALAGQAGGPRGLVRRLQQAWELLGIDRIATLVCAYLDPRNGALEVATAGHLPPLLVDATGTRYLPVDPAPPLGADGASVSTWSGMLPDDAVLVLFTDGLVEDRDNGVAAGMDLLARSAQEAALLPSEAVARHILDAYLREGEQRDDVALLVVKRRPTASPE